MYLDARYEWVFYVGRTAAVQSVDSNISERVTGRPASAIFSLSLDVQAFEGYAFSYSHCEDGGKLKPIPGSIPGITL